MALIDAMFEFSDAQEITSSAAGTNIIDMVTENLEMGAGQPFWLNCRVHTTFAGGTSLSLELAYDTVAPIDSSSTVVYQTPAIVTASLTAGTWIMRMPLPYNFDEESIVGVYYTVVGTHTAGNLDCWLDNGPQSSHDTQVSQSNI